MRELPTNRYETLIKEALSRKNIPSSFKFLQRSLKQKELNVPFVTSNPLVFLSTKAPKKYLLEFPIEKEFCKKTKWNDREDVLFYHGRIIPGKVSIKFLKAASEKGLNIVLQGPICKEYWVDEPLTGENEKRYKEELHKIKNIKFLDTTFDKEELSNNLNKYKFYFTCSTGEFFNIALQESIACGTIPVVYNNNAYLWADGLYEKNYTFEQIFNYYERIRNENLEDLSDSISKEAYRRMSKKSILEKYESSFYNKGCDSYIDFEIKNLVQKIEKDYNVKITESCSGHYDMFFPFIKWNEKNDLLLERLSRAVEKTYFKWSIGPNQIKVPYKIKISNDLFVLRNLYANLVSDIKIFENELSCQFHS